MPIKYIWNMTEINGSFKLNNYYNEFYCAYENDVASLAFLNVILIILFLFFKKNEKKLKILDNDIKKYTFGFIENSISLKFEFIRIILIVNMFIIIQKISIIIFPI